MRTAPAWIQVLEAAGLWGRLPWELAGGTPIIWYLRFEAQRTIEGEVAALKRQQAQQEAWLKGR